MIYTFTMYKSWLLHTIYHWWLHALQRQSPDFNKLGTNEFTSSTQRSLLWGSSRFSVENNFLCNTDRTSWTFDQRAHHDDLAANSGFSAEVLDLKYFSESGLWNVRLTPDQLKDSGVTMIFGPPASKLFGTLARWVTATATFSTPLFKFFNSFSGQILSAARVPVVAGRGLATPVFKTVQSICSVNFGIQLSRDARSNTRVISAPVRAPINWRNDRTIRGIRVPNDNRKRTDPGMRKERILFVSCVKDAESNVKNKSWVKRFYYNKNKQLVTLH